MPKRRSKESGAHERSESTSSITEIEVTKRSAPSRAASRKPGSMEPSSSNLLLGSDCLLVSPKQLRDLWHFDNQCGSKYLGVPLRQCKCEEIDDNSTGLSAFEMVELKNAINIMWEKAAGLFEIFTNPQEAELGYRIRVKQQMPIRLSIKVEDNFFFGWCAVAPTDSPCSHLYQRSPVKPNGYLGGPVSYLNWALVKETNVVVHRPLNRLVRHLVRLSGTNLAPGVELTWTYGSKDMPDFGEWFKNECCFITTTLPSTHFRHQRKNEKVPFMNLECCVLCGSQYSSDNKEHRIQRKPHFVSSHADYFGSSWDGFGMYMQQEVDSNEVLLNADKMNMLLQVLKKDLGWNIVPACKLFSISEEGASDLEKLKHVTNLLKASGTLVLRGMEIATSLEQLQPVPSSVWKVLKWKEGCKPTAGRYAVPGHLKEEHDEEVQAAITKFCIENL